MPQDLRSRYRAAQEDRDLGTAAARWTPNTIRQSMVTTAFTLDAKRR